MLNITGVMSGSDAVTLTVTTGTESCDLALKVEHESKTNVSKCDPDGAGQNQNQYLCQADGLQPGTWYEFTVLSTRDGGGQWVSVQTGEMMSYTHTSITFGFINRQKPQIRC